MRRILILIAVPILCAALGYGAGLFLRPGAPAAPDLTPEKMPVGQISIEIFHPGKITDLVAEPVMNVQGHATVEKLAAPLSVARLRDAILRILADAALTPALSRERIDKAEVGQLLQAGLVKEFPEVTAVTFRSLVQSDRNR